MTGYALQVISVNTADAETKQKSAQEKEAALQVESLQIAQDKEEAEQALSEAIPALEEAAAALNDLKRDDITEIRSFAKPHVLVQRVSTRMSVLMCTLSASSAWCIGTPAQMCKGLDLGACRLRALHRVPQP
jgi:hypothetical protein